MSTEQNMNTTQETGMAQKAGTAQVHTIAPVYDENSRILILGSFPSVKSREQGFFYGHPRNRFWKVLSALFGTAVPATVEEKKSLLALNNIALWDVIASCDITGSADSSIKNVHPVDLTPMLSECTINAIFTNGKTASGLYRKYIFPSVKTEDIPLPSTSPANASYSLERLTDSWKIITDYL